MELRPKHTHMEHINDKKWKRQSERYTESIQFAEYGSTITGSRTECGLYHYNCSDQSKQESMTKKGSFIKFQNSRS